MEELNFDDQQKEIEKQLKDLKKKSGSKIVKAKLQEEKQYNDKERQRKCKLARIVVNEGLDMYREGEMEFKEMIEDIYKTLQAIE